MKKLFIALLIIGMVAGIVLYLNRKTSKAPSVVTDPVIIQASTASSATSSTVVAGTPITATYSPTPYGNGVREEYDLTMTGVLLVNRYDFKIETSLLAYSGIQIDMLHVADNVVRLYIKNNSMNIIALPTLTISALKLN